MRWMNFSLHIPLLLILGYCAIVIAASSDDKGFNKCEKSVKKWASYAYKLEVIREDKHMLKDLLFFLHVPRTGGRTYYHCFLRKLYPDFLECPRSYDAMRYDPRKIDCHLLSTHDDYSVMRKLPEERTSVVSILRDPIDRLFSAYEFSIEVAARFMVHPNLTAAIKTTESIKEKAGGISTLNIWPWKFLVPWMIHDLFARKDARMKKGQEASLNSSQPYNSEDILMPLHIYINHPFALDIIHNGATFQIAGLTNNSYLEESHEVRHCVLKYSNLGQYVLDVAKRRLDAMLYIGLTEYHKESTTIFAHVVGAQVISQFIKSKFSKEFAAANLSESSSSALLNNSEANNDSSKGTSQQTMGNLTRTIDIVHENMTAEKLMDEYKVCVKNLRQKMSKKRIESLKTIHINFSKETRRQVPQNLVEEIESLNHLDMELHKYAKHLFAKQQNPKLPPIDDAEQVEKELIKSYDSRWTVFYLSLVPLFFFLLVAARTALRIKL